MSQQPHSFFLQFAATKYWVEVGQNSEQTSPTKNYLKTYFTVDGIHMATAGSDGIHTPESFENECNLLALA